MRLAAVLTVTAILAGGCRSEGLTLLSDADLPEDVYGSPGPTPTETAEIPAKGTVYLVRGERLVSRSETLQETPDSLAEALMLALITATSPDERVTNAIPDTTRLIEVRVDGPVATVDLSSEFEGAAPGDVQTLRIAQVVFTLTEEGTGINAVRISIDGVPQQLSPPGLLVTRIDYQGVAPPNEGRR